MCYVATGYTDLRKGIDGLAGLVQEQFQLDVFEDIIYKGVDEKKISLFANPAGCQEVN